MASSASQLIADDSAASRGFVSTSDLIAEERELDQFQHEQEARRSEDLARYRAATSDKGKGKASRDFSDYHDDDEDEEQGLGDRGYGDEVPLKERGKGRRRSGLGRRMRGALGGRSGGDGEEEQKKRKEYWRQATVNIAFILAWYSFSTLLSVYNKWMFSDEHYGFQFPLFVTSIHMAVQLVLASLALSIFPRLRSDSKPTGHEYATKAAPCGMATGLDIGLSNLSLKTITLSFYTMCKSSTLAFVLLFAFIFRIERLSLRLIGIIVIITSGVILMVSSETKFHFLGMIEVLTASALGGLRWSLTQMLLDKKSMGMTNPVNTLFWLAPIMGATLAICSMLFEGWITVFSQDEYWGGLGRAMGTMITILFPGSLAFCMNLAEFGLIQRTSVVTLSVAGIFKEVLTIFVGATIFGDELTPINITGLVITLFGIGMYNWFKYRQVIGKDAHGGHGGDGHGGRGSIDVERDPHRREQRRGLYSMVEESTVNVHLSDPNLAHSHTHPPDHKFHSELHTIGETDSESEPGDFRRRQSSDSDLELNLTKPRPAEEVAKETKELQAELKDDEDLKKIEQETQAFRKALHADEKDAGAKRQKDDAERRKDGSGSDEWELT